MIHLIIMNVAQSEVIVCDGLKRRPGVAICNE
jgi:hypothetical protein